MMSQKSSVPRCPVLVGQQNPQNTAVVGTTVPLVPNGWDSVSQTVPNTWDSVSQTVPRWWDSQTRRILRFFVSLSHHCPTLCPSASCVPLSLPLSRGERERVGQGR